jgi:hypothetical protein
MDEATQLSKVAYDRAAAFLKSHGADQTPHVNSNLFTHLEGTCELLREWGNAAPLCLAGLCHAVYGTDGFPVAFLDPSQRSELREIVGAEAEAIVYFYASCDRRYLYPQIERGAPVEFRDRFGEAVFVPDGALFRSFLELTFANELELAMTTPGLIDYTRETFGVLFGRCRGLVSEAAFAYFTHLCGESALSR